MKILLVTLSDNADHQDITFSMFKVLYSAGCDVWLIGTSRPKVQPMITPHTHLIDCPRRPGLQRQTLNLKVLIPFVRWVYRGNFDVIFLESLHVWNLPLMLFRRRKSAILQMIHDVIPHDGDRHVWLVAMMTKIACRLSDYVVLCSRRYLHYLTGRYGVPGERVRCVDMWRSFPKYSAPKFTKRVLFFGRMNFYKGVNNLLDIASQCPEISFDVAGRVDSSVRVFVNELAKLPNVTINDRYITNDEMSEAFVNSDWVILPYNSAAQSGVIIDAYRYGRPCIAFNVGALSEQILEGVTGFLVESGDNRAFSEKLKEVMSMSDDEFACMSKAAYEYGLRRYDSAGAAERFLNLVRTTYGGGGTSYSREIIAVTLRYPAPLPTAA